MAWPVWEGHGPLSFIASVDCAALPRVATEMYVFSLSSRRVMIDGDRLV
jgi:hypothetical protein